MQGTTTSAATASRNTLILVQTLTSGVNPKPTTYTYIERERTTSVFLLCGVVDFEMDLDYVIGSPLPWLFFSPQ